MIWYNVGYIFPFQTNIFQRYRKSSHFLTTLPWPLNIIRLVYSSSYRWIILYDSYTFRLLFTLGQKEMLVLPQMWLFDWLEIVVPLNHTYWNQKVIARMIFYPIRSGFHGHVRPPQPSGESGVHEPIKSLVLQEILWDRFCLELIKILEH